MIIGWLASRAIAVRSVRGSKRSVLYSAGLSVRLADRLHQQGVADWLRLDDRLGADIAAGARTAFHHDRLAKLVLQLLRDDAG
jgi:hypothetical protein